MAKDGTAVPLTLSLGLEYLMGVSVKNSQYDLSLLARKLEAARIKPGASSMVVAELSGGQKGVKFEGFSFREYETVLFGMLSFPDEIPEVDARRIVTQSIFQTAASGKITKERLLATLNRLTNEYLSQPLQRFVLATQISIRLPPSLERLPRIRRGDNVVMFGTWPRRFFQERDRADFMEGVKYILGAEIPNGYMGVRVSVKGRTIYQAANEALGTLNLIRGVWNWLENQHHYFRWSSGRREPVNRIVLGPLHTLHNAQGRLIEPSVWWYEPNYSVPIAVWQLSEDHIQKMYSFYKKVQKRLKGLTYGEKIEEAIVRYSGALDERDWESAFLRLWGVLELLTGNPGSYSVMIRRVGWLFGEQEFAYHQQVLWALKDYRNGIVHFDHNSHEAEAHLYQLKNYVEAMLRFLVWNRYNFKSFDEVIMFLSLPVKRQDIVRQLDIRKAALDYQERISSGK